ncbi:MAG: hypothetical protein ABJR46_06475 [Tateyamaria sp.]|uniref:hypothetical protein n=2 Tax=Tateyamaria sp. TaxID=1929288 RepID=UPI00329D1786
MILGWIKVSHAAAMATLFNVALPAHAWEFTPTPICTLTHTEEAASVELTYDHSTALYSINVTTPQGWPTAPAFSIRFDGPQPGLISTARHQIVGDTISVSDSGFGNVLDGLEINTSATAFTETTSVTVSLDGAAEPVARFRGCTDAPIA